MSNFVGISDPVCLELPELGLCEKDISVPVVPEDRCDRRVRPLLAVPCVSLAVALHGALVFLALTMVMGVSAPRPVIGISLLPAMGPGMTDRGGDQAGSSLVRAETGVPAAVRHAEPVANTDPAQKPATPASAGKKTAKVRVAPEKPRSEPVAAIRPRANPREPLPRSQSSALSAPAAPEQGGVFTAEDPGAEEETPGLDLQARHAGTSGAAEAMPPGPPGGMGGQGRGGAGAGGGPVGASFGDADGPSFVRRVMPSYPELARRRGREGLVLLRLVIGPGGELRDVQVVEGGGHGFDEAALTAVRASVYAPAMREGRGVECAALLPIRFALKGS